MKFARASARLCMHSPRCPLTLAHWLQFRFFDFFCFISNVSSSVLCRFAQLTISNYTMLALSHAQSRPLLRTRCMLFGWIHMKVIKLIEQLRCDERNCSLPSIVSLRLIVVGYPTIAEWAHAAFNTSAISHLCSVMPTNRIDESIVKVNAIVCGQCSNVVWPANLPLD